MTAHRRTGMFALAVVAVLAAGCEDGEMLKRSLTGTYYPETDGDARLSKTDVRVGRKAMTQTLTLTRGEGNAAVSNAAADRVRAVVRRMDEFERIRVTAPADATLSPRVARHLLMAFGPRRTVVDARVGSDEAASRPRVTVRASGRAVTECPDLPDRLAAWEPGDTRAIGCGPDAALARQVRDPGDFTGRPGRGAPPARGTRVGAGVQRYDEGEVKDLEETGTTE